MNKDNNQCLNATDDTISIKEYTDIRFDNLVSLFETKITANEKAVELASKTLSARLDLMNEFRMQLKDQAATFFPRVEHDIYIKSVDKDIRELRESKALLEGKASQNAVNLSTIIAIVGTLLAIISLVHSFIDSKPVAPVPVSIVQPSK